MSEPGPASPLLRMSGRTVLVAGASSGLGRETAVVLSELGARLVLTGRDRPRLEETLASLSGESHLVEPFDLNDADAIPGWIKLIVSRTGPLHGLVHCAGIQQTLPIQMSTAGKIEALMRTNVTSAILLLKGFRQKGCAAPGGSVVLLSGGTALIGRPTISVYSASKAALIGFARSAAVELAREGIRVNCIAPGYVDTEMIQRLREVLSPEQFQTIEQDHPLGLGTPRDVAWAVAFLLADTGRWITGTTLVVDGGLTI